MIEQALKNKAPKQCREFKADLPGSVIMKITGHATRELFDRYNTIDDAEKRKFVDQMEGHLKSVDQTPSKVKEG
jgi:hypothetical protein